MTSVSAPASAPTFASLPGDPAAHLRGTNAPAWNFPSNRPVVHVDDAFLDDCCCIVPNLLLAVAKKIICCDFFSKDKPQ